MDNGEQFVTMAGILMMPTLRVLRWDLLAQREYLQVTKWKMEKVEYGWIMWNAQGYLREI